MPHFGDPDQMKEMVNSAVVARRETGRDWLNSAVADGDEVGRGTFQL